MRRDDQHLPWWKGPTLLEALLAGAGKSRQTPEGPLRFSIQDVYRFDARRVIAGKLESGRIKVGDPVIFFPDRKTSRIKSIESWGEETPLREVGPGQSVAVTLEEQIFVERGHVGALPEDPPVESREVRARIFWLDTEPLRLQAPVTLRLGTQSVEARLVAIDRVVDAEKLEAAKDSREEVARF
jgi:bifunctional enzyme CysN/CysC